MSVGHPRSGLSRPDPPDLRKQALDVVRCVAEEVDDRVEARIWRGPTVIALIDVDVHLDLGIDIRVADLDVAGTAGRVLDGLMSRGLASCSLWSVSALCSRWGAR